MTKTYWLRLLFALPVALIGQQLLSQSANLAAEVGSVGAFVTAIGTLYSVLTGFTVISVWEQFTDTDRAVKREARGLAELYRYVGYVGDAEGVARARTAIVLYRDAVVEHEWPAMIARKSTDAAEDEYYEMADAVNGMKVTSAKDVPAWAEAVRTLGEVSDARGERLVFVAISMPRLLRILIYIATSTLIVGMAFLGFGSAAVGAIVLGSTVIVSLLVLEVIDDLDDPFTGAWCITSDPLRRIRFGAMTESPQVR